MASPRPPSVSHSFLTSSYFVFIKDFFPNVPPILLEKPWSDLGHSIQPTLEVIQAASKIQGTTFQEIFFLVTRRDDLKDFVLI